MGEVDEDRVRLGQVAPVVGLEHGSRAARVDARIVVGERFAGEDVDRHALVRPAEVREKQSHLVAVARGEVVIEAHAL